MTSRREFIGVATAALASIPGSIAAAPAEPWYRRTYRWGQTNITEKDPVRYDIPWWREFWKLTRIQGVIINAGGIVAYYRANTRSSIAPNFWAIAICTATSPKRRTKMV